MRKIVSSFEGQALNGLFDDAVHLGKSPAVHDLPSLLCSVRFADLGTANYRYSDEHYDVLIATNGWCSKFYIRNRLGYWAQVGDYDGVRDLTRHLGTEAPSFYARFVRVPAPHVEIHIHP